MGNLVPQNSNRTPEYGKYVARGNGSFKKKSHVSNVYSILPLNGKRRDGLLI